MRPTEDAPRSAGGTAGPSTKTMLRRLEQYRDRWSSYGGTTGIVAISDKPSVEVLRRFGLFADYDDRFLERISPDVSLVSWRAGSALFEAGAYLDLAFFVVEGEVEVSLEGAGEPSAVAPIFDPSRTSTFRVPPSEVSRTVTMSTVPPVRGKSRTGATANEIAFLATMDFDLPMGASMRLGPGEIFGEIGAMSGWPQAITARTATACQMVQIRVPALRLMKRRSSAFKDRVDATYRRRALLAQLRSTPLFQGTSALFLEALKEAVKLVSCEPDEVIERESEPADAVYLVRSGFVKLTQRFGEGEIVVSYLSKGMTLGEMELLIDGLGRWEATATSVEFAELVKIPGQVFRDLLGHAPEVEEQLWINAMARIKETSRGQRDIVHAEFTETALERGLVQGNSILVIDLDTCTRCDDCVRACAATHGGQPRFVREGDRVDNLLVARSCYHCRDPVCLVGCPTGAIHRAGIGAVVAIDDELCIGCSTCANNCPYDAIVMHETGETWPEDMVPSGLRGTDRLVASKCDLCHDTGHGPACVDNCPHGCAFRVGSIDEIRHLVGPEGDTE